MEIRSAALNSLVLLYPELYPDFVEIGLSLNVEMLEFDAVTMPSLDDVSSWEFAHSVLSDSSVFSFDGADFEFTVDELFFESDALQFSDSNQGLETGYLPDSLDFISSIIP